MNMITCILKENIFNSCLFQKSKGVDDEQINKAVSTFKDLA